MTESLADRGEEALLRWIREQVPRVPGQPVGLGDDCAVLPLSAEKNFLLTTDTLVEETHFDREFFTPEDLAHKTLAVNLSDIAAMGGIAKGVLLSLNLPPETPLPWFENFFQEFLRLAGAWQVELWGGNLSRAPQGAVLSVTAVGDVSTPHLKLRSGAQPGDFVYVSRPVGDAALGLELLRRHLPHYEELKRAQRRPEPELAVGAWLGQQAAVHALMDLSDGLWTDLPRLCESSGVSAALALEDLPRSESARAAATQLGLESPAWHALQGGEDYALLFTVDPGEADALERAFERDFSRRLRPVGQITEENELRVQVTEKGKASSAPFAAFEHFRHPH